jgi:hypothetical protein
MVKLESLVTPNENYQLISWLFLRVLALIYLIAFTSLATQINGLVGDQGILPLNNHFNSAFQHLAQRAWLHFPSIFWLIGDHDTVLLGSTLLGVLFSLILFIGRWERAALITLFLLYLSLYHAGQVFTNFQWDTLLLEAGFLAIFLAGGANPLLIFLFDWLLFRLRFMSGFFKLFSNDPSWSDFSALVYYFETQPLPHLGAWYAHQMPDILLKTGVGLTLFAELIVPFFIFLPRPFRLFAAVVTITIQLLIIATSNHNFINLLTIALCLFLLDDKLIRSLTPKRILNQLKNNINIIGSVRNTGIVFCFLMIFPASLISFGSKLWEHPFIEKTVPLAESVQRFGIGHIFHVFPTMQVQRHELVIQGSEDGVRWKTYQFKYKPGNPANPPKFNLPHQPRLDWMLWFVPTQHPVHMQWFHQFIVQLKQGSPTVTNLLASSPFPTQPPRYLRVLVFQYQFTNSKERTRNRRLVANRISW